MTNILMRKRVGRGGAVRQGVAGLGIGFAVIAMASGWQPFQRNDFSLHGDGPDTVTGAWTPNAHLAISLRLQVKG